MKHSIKNIHFVGIGGTGMSGIAEVLVNLGYTITGSDLTSNSATRRLQALGATVMLGHDPAYIEKADAIVVSSAVTSDNPEVVAARRRRIPAVPRAVMLAELMRLKHGIAVAGTHGKTTTTSLIASVLAEGGFDPTFVIGGLLNSVGSHAGVGAGDFIVVEADESDASFLNLSPVMEVITNIGADHMETYGHDFTRLKQAFIEFTHRLPFYGRVFLCIDDANVRDIQPFISKPITTYGFSEKADVRAVDARAQGTMMLFTVVQKGYEDMSVRLNQPGLHNVQNACAAVGIARELKIPDSATQRALEKFTGVNRRFTQIGQMVLPDGEALEESESQAVKTFELIDDYGHHPAEVGATIAAARGAYPERRLVLAFQPHRFTRTRDLFEDFVRALSTVDVLLLAEVHPAGESPIVAADGRSLSRAIRVMGKVDPVFVEDVTEMPASILNVVRDGDVVIVMGAGAISRVPGKLVEILTGEKCE